MNINAGYEITSKASIIHQIKLIRGITQSLHAKGVLWHQSAVDGLMKLCVYLKYGDGEVANRIPHGNKNCCSWPSAMKNQLGKKGKK